MVVSLLLSLSLVSLANAGDSELPLPVVGANMVTRDRCTMQVSTAPWNTTRAGKVAIDYAKAGSICLESEGDLEIAKAKAKAIIARGDAEASLVSAAAIPVMNGESVDYESGDGRVHLVTGAAADWHAYGTAVTAGNGMIGGMPLGYTDPSMAMLYRLSAGQSAFGMHPAIPGVVMPTQPAASDSVALGECRKALSKKGEQLEECLGGS